MNAETPELRLQPAAPDRRPAIWPWLVMPLATLTLFYGLNKLMQDYGAPPYGLITAAHHADETRSDTP